MWRVVSFVTGRRTCGTFNRLEIAKGDKKYLDSGWPFRSVFFLPPLRRDLDSDEPPHDPDRDLVFFSFSHFLPFDPFLNSTAPEAGGRDGIIV